jgi:fumarate reductase subunit C
VIAGDPRQGAALATVRDAAAPASPASVRVDVLCWIAQRASAAVLAVCVVVHLATMIVAVRGGLTAAEILGRTQGSAGWAAFYGVFVLAVAVHAPLGLRAVLAEWAGLRGRGVDAALAIVAAAIVAGGIAAIAGVVG